MDKLPEKYELDVDWHAYELRPPGSPPPPPEYLERIKAGRPQFEQTARERFGVEINAGPFGISSRLAHIGARFAASKGLNVAYHEAVLRAYWHEAQAIDDPEVLVEIAVGIGLDGPAFLEALDERFEEEGVESDVRQGHHYGITGVPAFIFDDKYLIMGAHPAPALSGFLDKVLMLREEEA